jgi:holo-[acyl-carrier protein] synthase
MTILGVGVDLVCISKFADQMALPGTQFERAFTPSERRDARSRTSDPAQHLAARWAAKEALIKAWSSSMHGEPPVMGEQIHHLIEVVLDAWGRPRLRLHGDVARALAGTTTHVSLSHDGDYATAYVTLT